MNSFSPTCSAMRRKYPGALKTTVLRPRHHSGYRLKIVDTSAVLVRPHRLLSISRASCLHSRPWSRISAKSIRNLEDRKEHAEDNGRISCYEFPLISRHYVFRVIIPFAADHTQSGYDPLMISATGMQPLV